jgi:hypothetical protein
LVHCTTCKEFLTASTAASLAGKADLRGRGDLVHTLKCSAIFLQLSLK